MKPNDLTSLKASESLSRRKSFNVFAGAAAVACTGAVVHGLGTRSARADEAKTLDGNPITRLIPANLETAEGKTVSRDVLAGKYVAVYFSAHWCPPCQLFTPKLVNFYSRHKKDLEIVFASSDHSSAEKAKYIDEAKMKWLSIPGQSNQQVQKMSGMLQVRGIPTLAFFDPEGQLMTTQGRELVEQAPFRAMKMLKKASEESQG